MTELSASDIMIHENKRKLKFLKKYEADHYNDLSAGPIYWVVIHEIETLKRQNREVVE
ncbi:hypothetical protein NIE88_09615 [Sporolactobacillus shoreicorticis]|uniref:Uncharacterized protein n=1 Tax=Sporolactobacillus shoreicorticis TaxID=1923877 RepID=A0ABW5S9Q5_9BACL|nr:hypothetical protein [Sporolactobacillus shoreicorticis]MCO7126032.1 hypothetical protein [Sporolactobacillus shoreicorticis]